MKFNHIKAKKGDGIFVVEKEALGSNDYLKPWFKNSDVGRYSTNNISDEDLIYACKKDSVKFPEYLLEHLESFREVIDASSVNSPYLHRPRNQEIFEQSKIVAPQRSARNTFGYNEIPWYASADVYFITAKYEQTNLKYILGLLNSKLYYVWLYNRGKRKGETLELYQTPLSEMPIKIAENTVQNEIVKLVDEILTRKESDTNLDISDIESRIDHLVYEIYGLTPEEIDLVEKNA